MFFPSLSHAPEKKGPCARSSKTVCAFRIEVLYIPLPNKSNIRVPTSKTYLELQPGFDVPLCE